MNEHFDKDAKEILQKFEEGRASIEEEQLVRRWFSETNIFGNKEFMSLTEENELFNRIKASITKEEKSTKAIKLWKYGAVAATLLIAMGSLIYINVSRNFSPDMTAQVTIDDALPGQNAAILELANGDKIKLDQGKSTLDMPGVSLDQKQGLISFLVKDSTTHTLAKDEFNTVRTSVGGQYTVILPDGSLAKLNSNSSIRFANQFGDKRRIEVEGEVYFDVKRDESKKFIVYAGYQYIEVLGTQFLIKSYPEEQATSTALISGSLLVASRKKGENHYSILKPGQVARNGLNRSLSVHNTNIEKERALQKGDFYFDGENLKEILTILSRWYDVKINYEFTPSRDIRYGGVISKEKNLSAVLRLLEVKEDIQFIIRGKEVTVRKRNN